MKQLSIIISLLISICVQAQIEKYIPAAPAPPRLVNDFANLLTEEQKQYLESKLVTYNDSTSNQIAIVTVENLHDYGAMEFATALGRKWGVGGKEFNNGIVILVSTGGGQGNRDAFIAVGYGLEGAIPDITANIILENELISNLRSGNYYGAFDKTTDALIKAAAGEYKASKTKRGSKGIGISRIIVIIIIIFIIMAMSGGGSGGGGFASRRGYRGFWGPVIFGGGFGGGSGGGGFGGGGFGGFGGGGFGGGGAGGKW